MHAVLKECEETLFTRPLPPARAERLKLIKDGCDKVLVDLQSLVEKYESLGTQSKRTWDRMRWGNEDIAEIRARLTLNITVLTAFISTSPISVETKLDKFIEEFRQGKREGSIVSLQTVDSLSADDRAVWRTIRKELEEVGISVAAFDANRNFIFDWFARAVEMGAFEEQDEHGIDEESNYSDERASRSSDEQGRQDTGRNEHNESGISASIRADQPLVRPQSSGSASSVGADVPERRPKRLDHILVPKPAIPMNRPRVRRVAALLAMMLRPRQPLINAVDRRDVDKALEILKNDASFYFLDKETLDNALLIASCHVDGSEVLLTELINRGANVNYISHDTNERTPLWNSVKAQSLASVKLLVKKGADVNYTGSEREGEGYDYSLEVRAVDYAPRASLGNVAILRLLLSSGVDVNARYNYHDVHLNWYVNSEMSLIQEAASLGEVAAIEVLLEFGAEIDAVSLSWGTALMLALSKGKNNAAKLLLEKGADPNLGSPSLSFHWIVAATVYKTPIEAAIFRGMPSMVQLLLDYGAVVYDRAVKYAKDYTFITGSDGREILHLLESRIPGPAF